jgi:AcrR family transcriptional regulator
MSPAAPYRHVPDKAHLVAAVAEQGFVELHRVLQDTATAFPDPRDALVQTGRRYVQWAVAHPDQYRVMFGAGLDGAALAGLRESGARSFDGLLGAITVSPAAQVIGSQDAHRLAGPLWALVHGVATLSIDGDLGHVGVDETPEDLAVRSIMLFLQGLV